MNYRKVWATYFSGTGTTEKVVVNTAQKMVDELSLEYEICDFTLPHARSDDITFTSSDIVVFGVPVIAGRVPNVLLKFLDTINGGGALAVPIVLYGNRNFDDALIELRDILEKRGFHCIAAAAFVGEHSFSNVLAKGRPNAKDMKESESFAHSVVEKIRLIYLNPDANDSENMIHLESEFRDTTESESSLLSKSNLDNTIQVDGTPYPYRGYYQPRDRHGKPIDIRKVIPVTNDCCTDCKLCATICPLGSINYDDVRKLNGICMKCCACIKKCPVGAKSFTDPGFIYHKEELEEMYKRPADNYFYLCNKSNMSRI
jgi:ferredoxin